MNAVGEQESKCFGKGKDGSIGSRLSAGKQLDRLEKKRSGYCVDRGSCYSDCINICRNSQKLCWSGLLPGIFLWLASLWKPGQIGSGDGIVLMGIGWIQGIQQVCMIFQTAILLAAGAGICMLALGKGRKKEIPFVPFLLAGYLIQYL